MTSVKGLRSASLGPRGLTLILMSAVSAILLTALHSFAKPHIADQQQAPARAALAAVFPAALHDNDLLQAAFELQPNDSNAALHLSAARTGYQATLAGQPSGVILPMETSGYGGAISLLIGIDSEGNITGVRVLQHGETRGLGDKLEPAISRWISSFNNRSLVNTPEILWQVKKDGGDFDQFVGATVTPRAVVAAVYNALNYFETNRDLLLQGESP